MHGDGIAAGRNRRGSAVIMLDDRSDRVRCIGFGGLGKGIKEFVLRPILERFRHAVHAPVGRQDATTGRPDPKRHFLSCGRCILSSAVILTIKAGNRWTTGECSLFAQKHHDPDEQPYYQFPTIRQFSSSVCCIHTLFLILIY